MKWAIVAVQEYKRRVRRKSFLLSTIITPAIILLVAMMPSVIEQSLTNESPVVLSTDEMVILSSILLSFSIYIFIYNNSVQVMRSIQSEKSNKVIEVILLSVDPAHLLLGKIISIGAAGLTQILIWTTVGYLLYSGNNNSVTIQLLEYSLNWKAILPCYITLFILGYILYSLLFAIIGIFSSKETDTQQFQFIMMAPVLFSVFVGIASSYNSNTLLADICAYIPLTSPVVMITKVCHCFSIVEFAISALILLLTDTCIVIFAGKLYRRNILNFERERQKRSN